ncbi:MAG TPA: hypothetical protein VKE22_11070 [Haliangiales bacterium]|nr:hypothetical protein [Haliangiales bacterium]
MAHRGRTIVLAGLVGLAFGVLAGCGGGGTTGGPPDAPIATPDAPTHGTMLSGTAAMGGPIAGAAATAKDQTGAIASATTDSAGRFSIAVGALAGPFLLKVDPPGKPSLYSVAPAPGAANVDPYTHLVTDTVYRVHGTTAADAYAALSASNPVPAPIEVQSVAGLAKTMIQKWLQDAGVAFVSFDLMAGAFAADHTGFDLVLDRTTIASGTVTITDGTTTQTSTVTANASGLVKVDTTTVAPSGTSSSTDSTQVPTTANAQAAVAAIQALFAQFAQTINSKGQALTDQDILPFLAPDFQDGEGTRAIFAAMVATDLRGGTIDSFSVDRIASYDDAAKVITVNMALVFRQGGQASANTETMLFTFKQEGSWLLYGDQKLMRIARAVQMEMRTDSFPGQADTTYRSINVDVEAPTNTITGITISGGPFNNTPVPKSAVTRTRIFHPTPTTDLTYVTDAFFVNPGPQNSLPPPGTVFTFNATRAAGPPLTYTLVSTGVSGEAIQYTVSPATHVLSTIVGHTLTVTWQLPRTYASTRIQLSGSVRDNQTEVFIEQAVGAGATSGMINYPATMPGSGNAIVQAYMNLSIEGPHGERGIIVYNFQ